jgi:hypothetical protein
MKVSEIMLPHGHRHSGEHLCQRNLNLQKNRQNHLANIGVVHTIRKL